MIESGQQWSSMGNDEIAKGRVIVEEGRGRVWEEQNVS